MRVLCLWMKRDFRGREVELFTKANSSNSWSPTQVKSQWSEYSMQTKGRSCQNLLISWYHREFCILYCTLYTSISYLLYNIVPDILSFSDGYSFTLSLCGNIICIHTARREATTTLLVCFTFLIEKYTNYTAWEFYLEDVVGTIPKVYYG